LFESHKKTIDFRIVYIRDTHPVLGFRAPTNDRRGIAPDNEPRSLADRERWACEDRKKMSCSIPVVMDGFDDKTLTAYDAFPQRVYVLDKSGKVVYRSSGLVGFDLDSVTKAVKSLER
jgi:type I thyroxine 5'-deiodinase